MFRSGTSSNMNTKIYERVLRLIPNDHTSDFNTLLQNNNDTCNHHRNIQSLNLPVMDFMFERRNSTYKLRNSSRICDKK